MYLPSSCTVALLTTFAVSSLAAATPPARTRLLTAALHEPVCISQVAGDPGHVLVCERDGLVRAVDTTTGAIGAVPFADLRPLVSTFGDGGLMGLAFDPGYASNGYVYMFYNNLADDDRVLARYHAAPGSLTVDAGTGVTLWKFARSVGHNGGWIDFSPINGYLYLSMGDGGTGFSFDAPNRAQTIENQLHGKILRIDVTGDDFPADANRNYRIPPSNPFVGIAGDDEIWAYGVRNPWRCSFDRATGELYIADVGQDAWEEIDREPAVSAGGRNYGWRCMEASACTNLGGCTCLDASITLPLFEYDHTLGNSLTGGYVYRGSAIPGYQGLYIYGDFGSNRYWTFRPGAAGVTEWTERTSELRPSPSENPPETIGAFGEDAAGELYMADFFAGRLYKIVPDVPVVCPADFNGVGGVSVQDIFDFLAAYFAADPRADFNGVGGISVQDIFDFLAAYFAGC
jgi:glucose/arabinose dehydrogenase